MFEMALSEAGQGRSRWPPVKWQAGGIFSEDHPCRLPVDPYVAELRERPDLVQRMQLWLDRSQTEGEHETMVLDHTFAVLRGVFSPRYYPETEFYAGHVLGAIEPGCRFLDLGCGVGVNAVLAAMRGAIVVACDVNPAAVENTRHNAARHGVQVDVRESDVFSALQEDERFDVVYWNVPFAYRRPDVSLSPLQEAIFDPGYQKNRAFLAGVCDHLETSGVVLMGISSTLGEQHLIDEMIAEAGLSAELVAATVERGTSPTTRLELVRLCP